MKTFKIWYHYQGSHSFGNYDYIEGKDEAEARDNLIIKLDDDETKGIVIDKIEDADAVYIQHGFKDRTEYLYHLSDEYNVEYEAVLALAEVLGRSEDFDGLVSSLDRYSY